MPRTGLCVQDGKIDLTALGEQPAVAEVVEGLLRLDPRNRPGVHAAIASPCMWTGEEGYDFGVDFGNAVEQLIRVFPPPSPPPLIYI